MRLNHLLGVLSTSLMLACGSAGHPGEMPPLAPRPDPVQPAPVGGDDPSKTPDGKKPVPGAPDPIPTPPAPVPLTVRDVPMPEYGASGEFGAAPSDDDAIAMQKVKAKPDAAIGGGDAAAPLPPVPDALPVDASQSSPQPKH